MTEHAAHEWDARTYHRVAQPHAAWGVAVLDRLRLTGDETVLDAGCGSGRVTALLLERLPRGRVIAADRSASMLAEARSTLAEYAPRVTFLEADLVAIDRELEAAHVDGVFSTATFHWIDDHPRLFGALHAITRPGGQLVAQCGGGPNLSRFQRATDAISERAEFREHLAGRHLWRNYVGADTTRDRLETVGYTDVRTWLEESPQDFADAHAFAEFCSTVVLSRHVAALPDALRQPFARAVADEVAAREGRYTLDYVRLNMDARRA